MKTKRVCGHIHIMTSQMQIIFDKFEHLIKPICFDPWKFSIIFVKLGL